MKDGLEMKSAFPEKWKETGRVVHGGKSCPDCFGDPDRKARGGGIVKEYKKGQGAAERYAYRCVQKKSDGSPCDAVVDNVVDHPKTDLDVEAIMETGYLRGTNKTAKGEDFE